MPSRSRARAVVRLPTWHVVGEGFDLMGLAESMSPRPHLLNDLGRRPTKHAKDGLLGELLAPRAPSAARPRVTNVPPKRPDRTRGKSTAGSGRIGVVERIYIRHAHLLDAPAIHESVGP